jgi:hypothetical protein
LLLLGWQTVQLLPIDSKLPAFRVACSEKVHFANAFGMRSSNSSFATKSCACASITFLAGFVPWSVDSRYIVTSKLLLNKKHVDVD